MLHKDSLKTKVLLISLTVATAIAAILGGILYITQIKPLDNAIKQTLIQEMQQFIDAKIDLKIQAGIVGATMVSIQPSTFNALKTGDTTDLKALLKGLKDDYANKTNFQGIFSEVIDAQGQSILRSWNLNTPGQNLSNDGLVKNVLQTKKAQGSLAFGERGVVITAVSPVLDKDNKNLIGLTTMVQGVGSISRDFSNEFKGAWIMLIDKHYVQKTTGNLKAIEALNDMTDRYVLANNKWFSPEVIALTQKVYQPVHDDEAKVYLKEGHVIVDLPAYDQENRIFARQIFIQNAAVYTQPLIEATQQAWLTLASVIGAILILALFLLSTIIKLVIKPLENLKNTILQVEQTGDFNIRSTIKSLDEVGLTAQAINHHLDKVSNAIKEANTAVLALSNGNLNQRINGDYVGDLQTLQLGINQSTQNVGDMISEIAKAIGKLRQGEFKVEINTQAQGVFANILKDTVQAMQQLDTIIQQTNSIMIGVSKGIFQQRIDTNAMGDLGILKDAINRSLYNLNDIIQDITQVMGNQSQGDLVQRVVVVCEGDLLTLKTAINNNANQLNGIIRDVIKSANEVSTAAAEVSQGSLSLSDSVQQQAASMEETSATMDEINSAIKANTKNTISVDRLEHELEINSKKASSVMHETIEAMDAIQGSSNKIGEIVSLIDSIAFQTNLLALNAAVEAARAGDHGRGFAVVAGEVRNLAGKSAEAAKDINTLISDSITLINRGTDLASESEQVLNQMNGSITQVTKMVAEIASTSAEQAHGVGEINQALRLIDEVTQQNAALVEETSAAAQSLEYQAQHMHNLTSRFKIS